MNEVLVETTTMRNANMHFDRCLSRLDLNDIQTLHNIIDAAHNYQCALTIAVLNGGFEHYDDYLNGAQCNLVASNRDLAIAVFAYSRRMATPREILRLNATRRLLPNSLGGILMTLL
ncbi:MAG: hypothetical protein LBG04_01660 [Holosporaceae bacterium]|nr:hypothetical protein [Holosporaceae bacterium]